MNEIKTIAFDADDTLWINEPYFQEVEKKYCELLEEYLSQHHVSQELFKTEMKNLSDYGFGIKSFVLSMIETAIQISEKTISLEVIEKILGFGHEMINQPVILLDGVEEILKKLQGKYRLIVATKGDLLDQERKLEKSLLGKYFHHIEIMSDKKEKDYKKLLKQLDEKPEHFVMIGNSIKSDILPVLNLGAYAIHIPYHTTWAHEHVEHDIQHANFRKCSNILDVISFFK